MVFHGPSPTLCIASGGVWFDYPAVNKVGCYSRQTVHQLRVLDRRASKNNKKKELLHYDWKNFDSSIGVCLRLSEHAFNKVPLHELYSRKPPTKLGLSKYFE